MVVPRNREHVQMVESLAEKTKRASKKELKRHRHEIHPINMSLSALYIIGTCGLGCRGGPHVLEYLAGRAYNLACAAQILIFRGFYDEALSLVRSLGEISNLILMSVTDKTAFQQWLEADRNTRLREFQPSRIRKLLEAQSTPMIADQDWYSSFCERFTHVGPATKPNIHNESGTAHIGGVLQVDGLEESIGELATVLASVAMPLCRYFNIDYAFEALAEWATSRSSESAPKDEMD